MAYIDKYLPLWDIWHTLIPVSHNFNNIIFEAIGDEEPFCANICHLKYSSGVKSEDIWLALQDYYTLAESANLASYKKCIVYERINGMKDVFLFIPGLERLDNLSLSIEQLPEFALQISAALSTLHDYGITHGNLNPSNIFYTSENKWLLGGHIYDSQNVDYVLKHNSYRTGIYTAPETKEGEANNKLGDIYSLGVLLYVLYNDGTPPKQPYFSAPRNANSQMSEIILKACAFDPDERWQSANEIYEALNLLNSTAIKTTNSKKDSTVPLDIGITHSVEPSAIQQIESQSSIEQPDELPDSGSFPAESLLSDTQTDEPLHSAEVSGEPLPFHVQTDESSPDSGTQTAESLESAALPVESPSSDVQNIESLESNASPLAPHKYESADVLHSSNVSPDEINEPKSTSTMQPLPFSDAKSAIELYPELSNYLNLFEPEASEFYFPTVLNESSNSTDTRLVKNHKQHIFQAAILLFIAFVIVFVFIIIGLRQIPNLEPSLSVSISATKTLL